MIVVALQKTTTTNLFHAESNSSLAYQNVKMCFFEGLRHFFLLFLFSILLTKY